MFVACIYADKVVKLSRSGKVLNIYKTGENPNFILIDNKGNVWTANSGDGTVTKISGATRGKEFFPYKGPIWQDSF